MRLLALHFLLGQPVHLCPVLSPRAPARQLQGVRPAAPDDARLGGQLVQVACPMRNPLQGRQHVKGPESGATAAVCAGEAGTPWRHKKWGTIFLQRPLQA